MKTSEWIDFLANPDNSPETLLEGDGKSRRALVKPLLAAIDQSNKRAKNRAVKLLAKLSESNPRLILPQLEKFVRLLDRSDTILLWNSIAIIGHLAAVDAGVEVEALAPRLHRFFKADSMVTTAHAIEALGRIAAARPKSRT